MKFYINGLCIRLQYSFFLMLAFSLMLQRAILPVLLFSALHEAGHILSLYLLGGRAEEITIAYYGIGLKHRAALSEAREIIFLLSGVAVNALFALLKVYGEINTALLVMNLLPIYPLDGGRAVKIIFNHFFGLRLSDKLFQSISAVMLVLLVITAVYCKNMTLFLIVIYLIAYSMHNSFD